MTLIITITFIALVVPAYVLLRKAINKDTITRVERGNHVDVYVNGTLINSFTY